MYIFCCSICIQIKKECLVFHLSNISAQIDHQRITKCRLGRTQALLPVLLMGALLAAGIAALLLL